MKREMFLALAFSLVMAACDKEEPLSSGKDVLVQVRMVGIAGGGEEDVTRSTSESEPETVITPISDGMVLEMRMERDTSLLRAGKLTLGVNSYFRVIALKTGTKEYVSHDDFTINGGAVSGTLRVPDNATYDFICYSYNDDTSLSSLSYSRGNDIPDTEVLDAMIGTKDLLYQKITMPVSGSAPVLTIELGRVMAQVKLQIDCSYNGWKIVDVIPSKVVFTAHTSGTIVLTSKAVTSSTGAATVTTWPAIAGTNMKEDSNAILMMPNAAAELVIAFTSGAIVLESPLAAVPGLMAIARFSTELKSGYSYRLCMKMSRLMWAGSNVYWDETSDPLHPTLTFDPYQADGTLAPHKGLVGVHFKWGSLVGVDPYGRKYTEVGLTPDVYIPDGAGGWTRYVSTASPYPSWESVPYWNSGNVINNSQYGSHRGDICAYLSTATGVVSGNYRMPRNGEFSPSLFNAITGWSSLGSFKTSLSGYSYYGGNYDLIGNGGGYAKNTTMGNVHFPASGFRSDEGNSGAIPKEPFMYTDSFVNYEGAYWTGTTSDATHIHMLNFVHSNNISMLGSLYSRDYAMSVRCVRAN
jgi:hypothetical protein